MTTEPKRSTVPVWVVPVIVGVVVVVILAWILTSTLGANKAGEVTPPQSVPTAEAAPEEVVEEVTEEEVIDEELPDLSQFERRDPADVLAIGPVDAPVGMVVFSDYQCGYCAKWSTETLPEMVAQADAGNLRIEWRDINIFGEDSRRAALASYAAARQGAFLEYHDALFEGGQTRPAAQLTQEALVGLAGTLGLDTAQFAADMDSEQAAAEIDANQQLGMQLGVSSTPSFILGGQPIVGAQPTEVFIQTFDTALAAARG